MRWTLQLARNVESSRRWLQLPPVTMRGLVKGKVGTQRFYVWKELGT
jgi:hypothetical protein